MKSDTRALFQPARSEPPRSTVPAPKRCRGAFSFEIQLWLCSLLIPWATPIVSGRPNQWTHLTLPTLHHLLPIPCTLQPTDYWPNESLHVICPYDETWGCMRASAFTYLYRILVLDEDEPQHAEIWRSSGTRRHRCNGAIPESWLGCSTRRVVRTNRRRCCCAGRAGPRYAVARPALGRALSSAWA